MAGPLNWPTHDYQKNDKGCIYKWRGGRANWAVRGAIADGFEKTGKQIVKKIKSNLSTPWPPASNPGQFPHKRTGNLQQAVDYWLNGQVLELQIGVNIDAPYWNWLEDGTKKMLARPFVMGTIDQMRAQITHDLGESIRKAFQRFGGK